MGKKTLTVYAGRGSFVCRSLSSALTRVSRQTKGNCLFLRVLRASVVNTLPYF